MSDALTQTMYEGLTEASSILDQLSPGVMVTDESWRIRSEALHKASMGALKTADRTERASLEAFEKVKTASLQ